ncbi:MAG: cellulase family glycosylhydrolase [Marinilabiliaceae bacterium]
MSIFSKLIRMACLATVPVAMTGCGDDDGGSAPATDIVIPEAYRTLTFAASGGEQPLMVQSTVDINASPDVDWIDVQRVESTSSKIRKFAVTCKPSTDGVERKAVISLTASGYEGKVDVTQLSGAVISLVSDSVVSVGAALGSVSIVVNANAEPSFSSSASWLNKWSSEQADGKCTVVVAVAKNLTTEARDGRVTLTNEGASVSVRIKQAAAEEGGDDAMPSSATELVAKFYAGINIGNTMECPSGEGAWSGSVVTPAYVAGLKALGFNAVRIPCAWHSYFSDAKTYAIKESWMSRVKEVVDYCLGNDMYVVLNSHWDTGWLEDNIFSTAKQSAIIAEQKAIWTQVAEAFKDYDEHLLFAGCNEPGMNETSTGGKKWDTESVARLVKYEQTFIDAVCATGGNNAKRCLVFQGLGTDIESTSASMTTLPTDPAGRLIAEVHYYEPYQWAQMEKDADWGKVFWYWGKDNHKSGSAHNPNWGEEQWVKDQFAKMKEKFVDKGIPVIVGEFSSRIQTAATRSDKSEEFDEELHKKSRAYYNEVVTREAKNYGCAPFYWETGGEINRKDGTAKNQYAIDGIMRGAEDGAYPF